MTVVETYADRMITFSKRKARIYKKIIEIIKLCDVEATFLIFSEGEKPYTFENPSIKELAGLLKNSSRQEPPHKDNTLQIIKAYKKKKIRDLVNIFEPPEEELVIANEKLKMLKKSRNKNNFDKVWWNSPLEDLSMEACKQRHQASVELHDASSSSHTGLGHSGEA